MSDPFECQPANWDNPPDPNPELSPICPHCELDLDTCECATTTPTTTTTNDS